LKVRRFEIQISFVCFSAFFQIRPVSDSLIIIPTYNERENIVALLVAILSLEQHHDILIIDDSSPDGTADLVREMQERFGDRIQLICRKGKHGLGTAYIEGFRYALRFGYDYVFEMDADFSHNPADLIRLYRACADGGCDMAIGSRYATGVNVVNWPIGRVLLSYFASKYVQWITGMPVRDATAGFVCYRKRVLQAIDLGRVRFIGYAFQIEMKFTAWKHGFTLREVPIVFTNRELGQSKMSPRIFKEAFIGVIRMKFRSIFRPFPRLA
jgi:dolichol-phosphate mannosyltransferase